MAGKIVRYEFVGSYFYVLASFFFVVTIPLAIIHIICETVRIDEDLDNPSEFFELHKTRTQRD